MLIQCKGLQEKRALETFSRKSFAKARNQAIELNGDFALGQRTPVVFVSRPYDQ